jgi:hypothetical protein
MTVVSPVFVQLLASAPSHMIYATGAFGFRVTLDSVRIIQNSGNRPITSGLDSAPHEALRSARELRRAFRPQRAH